MARLTFDTERGPSAATPTCGRSCSASKTIGLPSASALGIYTVRPLKQDRPGRSTSDGVKEEADPIREFGQRRNRLASIGRHRLGGAVAGLLIATASYFWPRQPLHAATELPESRNPGPGSRRIFRLLSQQRPAAQEWSTWRCSEVELAYARKDQTSPNGCTSHHEEPEEAHADKTVAQSTITRFQPSSPTATPAPPSPQRLAPDRGPTTLTSTPWMGTTPTVPIQAGRSGLWSGHRLHQLEVSAGRNLPSAKYAGGSSLDRVIL